MMITEAAFKKHNPGTRPGFFILTAGLGMIFDLLSA
jgi:hypothetical protein